MSLDKDKIKEGFVKANRSISNFDIIDPLKPIKVGCNSCGKCCRNRNDILLKPNDIYSIAISLNKSIQDVLRYTEIYIGDNSQIPIIALKFRVQDDGNTICPFLKKVDDKTYHCRVHTGKPNVCRIYPLGKISENNELYYIMQDIDCVTEEEKFETTVEEWTLRSESFGDEFFLAYYEMIRELDKKIKLKKMWKVARSRGKEDFAVLMQLFTNTIYMLDVDKSLKENLEVYTERIEYGTEAIVEYLKKTGYGVIK